MNKAKLSQAYILFTALTVVGIAAVLVIGQDLSEIPTDLSFSCDGRAYGYYADPATNCQVFHICLGDGDIKWSFLCPNQTIFNQVEFMISLFTEVCVRESTKAILCNKRGHFDRAKPILEILLAS